MHSSKKQQNKKKGEVLGREFARKVRPERSSAFLARGETNIKEKGGGGEEYAQGMSRKKKKFGARCFWGMK